MNAPPGLEVDHINGDRLDNRRENLRLCTRRQNTRNAKARSACGYRGVSHDRGRWRSRIHHVGVGALVSLGSFDTPEEAARAFDRAARRLHGAFARLNFDHDFIEPGAWPKLASRIDRMRDLPEGDWTDPES